MALLQKAYLGATPLFRSTSFFEDDSETLVDSSADVTVTANSSAHTKGAWAEIIANSSANASLLYVIVGGIGANATDTSTLLDIGTGASGFETALVSNIAVGGAVTTTNQRYAFGVPIRVPSGTRLSARIQSLVTGGKTATVAIKLYDMGDYNQAPTTVDTIGTDTATSTGTDMVTANTYVQLTASTSRAYRAIMLLPNVSGNGTTNVIGSYTLAKGASGSEVEIAKRDAGYTSGESVCPLENPLIAEPIASGTPLAVKVQGPTVNINQYGVCLIGIP